MNARAGEAVISVRQTVVVFGRNYQLASFDFLFDGFGVGHGSCVVFPSPKDESGSADFDHMFLKILRNNQGKGFLFDTG